MAASELLRDISPNYKEIDPCNDFRSYICEGWDLGHDLREDQSDAFTGTYMHETSQTMLRHILEAPFPKSTAQIDQISSTEEENFNKMQATYSSCMDESTIKAQHSGPLIDILRKVEDIFPAKKPYDMHSSFVQLKDQQQMSISLDGKEELSNVVAFLLGIGIDALVSLGVDVRFTLSYCSCWTVPSLCCISC